ncbi:5-(carboxyamino)imidazole ribonucleotide mutase [Hydrogenobacter hydrogenophilus]|uniref:N5-carboxyaminoimidazole ribonucleotide mutase n=1 Tax=Hydrogenobacter hydrogenophilus TaxID=35835 RepID=A0A285P0C8_9AQUI|nr:5-(carboxyamino)imidazole ribonucleotide mutase [Hydrogenobacter hydrogenophilus]SNZ14613.1 5-(carboxyamino)imidazole ribonucleotide mutase [Hydrogenobacter hydrogenophilus]
MKVAIIMGSISDWEHLKDAYQVLKEFGVECEVKVVSAHRTPELMYEFAKTAKDRGIEVIIAGAGGSAHLPGMTASLTTLPVIGVPVPSKHLSGIDSLYSIVQMPPGVPVATVGIGNATNAGLLALRILALKYDVIAQKLQEYRNILQEKVEKMNQELNFKL